MVNISLNQLAYDLYELYRPIYKGQDALDIRQFKIWVQTTRAQLCKQHFDKDFTWIDESFIQDLNDVATEVVDTSLVTGIPVGRYCVRTTIDIPYTIERSNHIGSFVRIGPSDISQSSYNVVSAERAAVSGNGKFNKNDIFAFVRGTRIYLTSKSQNVLAIKYLDIRGVFQNPTEAALISDPNYTDNDRYPVSMSMVDQMKKLILDTNLKLAIMPYTTNTVQVPNEEENLKNP